MKYFIGLTLLALVALSLADMTKLTEEQKAKIMQYSEECIKQENISLEDANKLKAKDLSNSSQPLKCYWNCLFEKFEAIKDGTINEAHMLKHFTEIVGEANAKIIMSKCAAIKGADKCDTAFKVIECIQTALP